MNITIKIQDCAATVSALCALITLFILIWSLKQSNKEKKRLVKANFFISSELIGSKKLSIDVKNKGYENISDVKVFFLDKENKEFNCITIDFQHIYKDQSYTLKITIDYKKIINEEDIKGFLVIEYKDIYGNISKSLKEIEIDTKIHSLKSKIQNSFFENL